MDYRARLFENNNNTTRRPTPNINYSGSMNSQNNITSDSQSLIENHNDRMIDHLGDRVSLLHQLTLDINKETKDQNNLLNDLDDEFDRTGNVLGKTIKKLENIMKSGGGNQLIYLVIFMFVLFLFMYLFLRK